MTRLLAGARRRPERSAGRGRGPANKRAKIGGPQSQLNSVNWSDEKRQLTRRLPRQFVLQTLHEFNSGRIGVPEACQRLHVGKTRLYQLRTRWLQDREAFQIKTSGGDHRGSWPAPVITFLREFVPLQTPCNFQLVADELLRLYGLKRARSSVEAYIKTHLHTLIPSPAKKPRTYRRFRRARFGELFQHDSSIHQWWPGPEKQTLLLTLDDHSGLNIAGRFVTRDTTWAHFLHFREAFERFGIPQAIYTDGLSLFGPSSSHDHLDPRSEFQRALRAIGVAHLVAPSPQAKGKIERRFGTFQKRLVTLLAHAKVDSYERANEILQMEIKRQNSTRNSSTGEVPNNLFEQSQHHSAIRPSPPTALLDLHLSLRTTRKVAPDHSIEFEGQTYKIAPTLKKSVTVIYHPQSKLWVLEEPPNLIWPSILGHFSM